jgi:predicted regulator of Ras-like GTPase activity (Roadblock/LC7/MglB family)
MLPYRPIIETLLARVPGARTALLLDVQGEVVVGAGDLGERQRLIGAYEGIALGIASRTAARFDAGAVRSLVWRHDGGAVVLSTLKDGYYLVLSLGPTALVPAAVRHAEDARQKLEDEI